LKKHTADMVTPERTFNSVFTFTFCLFRCRISSLSEREEYSGFVVGDSFGENMVLLFCSTPFSNISVRRCLIVVITGISIVELIGASPISSSKHSFFLGVRVGMQ